MIALVDCNNFFVSCERIFRPDLHNKPVAVLSSNDGCLIARSEEVKALGVPMGAPLYKYDSLLKSHKAHLFSSNFSLYRDISTRVMQLLHEFCDSIETYSIDEAFINLSLIKDPLSFAKELKKKIATWIGIPVSIGIAQTKTLAKVANKLAKKKHAEGVYLLKEETRESTLSQIDLYEIWGIGKKSAQKLYKRGLRSALDFANMPPHRARMILGLFGEQSLYELQGTACIAFEENESMRKSICVSRSFSQPLESLSSIEEGLCHHVIKACEKLYKCSLVASELGVFLQTSRYIEQPYFGFKQHRLLYPSSSCFVLTPIALKLLSTIYRKDLSYTKVGIHLFDLENKNSLAPDFFENPKERKQTQLEESLHSIHKRYGTNSLVFAKGMGSGKWRARAEHKSPNYTTCFDELMRVY